jgi:hypothetical protein
MQLHLAQLQSQLRVTFHDEIGLRLGNGQVGQLGEPLEFLVVLLE